MNQSGAHFLYPKPVWKSTAPRLDARGRIESEYHSGRIRKSGEEDTMGESLRAGLGRRFAASLVDIIGIVITGFLLAGPLQDVENALGLVRVVSIDTNADALMVIILALWGGAWTYPLIEIGTGASPGKWLTGLRIRRPDGTSAGIVRRLIRAVLKNAVLFVVLPFGMIENTAGIAVCFVLALTGLVGIFLVFGADRRALHDKISGTAVVPRSVPV
jgi:uncharacterized RDD family membrane protein YckC